MAGGHNQVSGQSCTCTSSVWTELFQGESSELGPEKLLSEGDHVETAPQPAFPHLRLLPRLLPGMRVPLQVKTATEGHGTSALKQECGVTRIYFTCRHPLLRQWVMGYVATEVWNLS